MPIDLRSLTKLDAASAVPAPQSRVVVLVKVRDGARKPAYFDPRGQIAEGLFSAELAFEDVARLESDPSVESVTISRKMPVIR